MDENDIKKQIDELLQNRDYEMVRQILAANQEIVSNDLIVCQCLFEVYAREKAMNQCTVFEKTNNLKEVLERFTKLKFYLRRIEFGVIDGTIDEFCEFLVLNRVSPYELLAVVDCSVIHKSRVMQVIMDRIQ